MLGRGELTNILHVKLGRAQAKVTHEASGELRIVRLGKNPSFLTPAGGSVQLIEQGEPQLLSNGDTIWLLRSKFPYLVVCDEAHHSVNFHTDTTRAKESVRLDTVQQQPQADPVLKDVQEVAQSAKKKKRGAGKKKTQKK